jgi:hypothetical protein
MAKRLRRTSVIVALVAAFVFGAGAGGAAAASWGGFQPEASWGE